MSRRAAWTYVLIVVGALWWLRAQLVAEVGVPLRQAVALGLLSGLLLDVAMALLVVGGAISIGAGRPRIVHYTAIALAFFVLGFTTANVAFFGYFDARLEPWVIRAHARDLPAIRESLWSLLKTPVVFVCVVAVPFLLLVAVTVLLARHPSGRPLLAAKRGLALVAAAIVLVISATAIKYRVVGGSSIVAEQVFVIWIEGEFGLRPVQGRARHGIERTLQAAVAKNPFVPDGVLAKLRDWNPQREPVPTLDDVAAMGPFARPRDVTATHTRALRARLGLPIEGPVHIIVLFLESVRAFEMEHPALWPDVFPHTRALFARHALRFPTAYTSGWGIGRTVDGQFQALCSLLPDFGSQAVYVTHPDFRATSLAEVAREHGYRTVWISGTPEDLHSKRAFESRHGTDDFFAEDYLGQTPYEGTHPYCGYPDGPMLQQAMRILEREAQHGRPIFANILTMSTHDPVSEIPEGQVPAPLRAAATRSPAQNEYVGYLSRLRYLDESLDRFFTALFDSPLGDQTLVVVLGDHGAWYKPHIPIAQHQAVELMTRIPFALVTKHLPVPGTISYAIHQIDVAPTVADIVGFGGKMPWLGRNVLDGPGSPWVIAHDEQLAYRFGDHACYTLQGDDSPRCYRIEADTDPMLRADLSRVRADPAEERFVQSVTIAAHQAIALNHFR